jgi:hypothetical protein
LLSKKSKEQSDTKVKGIEPRRLAGRTTGNRDRGAGCPAHPSRHPDAFANQCVKPYGRLVSSTVSNSTLGVLTSASYGYGPEGRQNTVTDARKAKKGSSLNKVRFP